MCKFIFIALLATIVNCQSLHETDDNPLKLTRYVLSYAGVNGEEGIKQYFKPTRRAQRLPASAYQYEDEEEYYPTRGQKPEPENYGAESETVRYQEQSTRLRVAKKHQGQAQIQAQVQAQPVEQYLKEVNPTTKTNYQRPSPYLRFAKQDAEESQSRPHPIRYVLQPEQQQKAYQPQYEPPTVKPVQKPPHFNLVAYQNALSTQQRLQAAENQEPQDTLSKSSVYVQQTISKKPAKKPKNRAQATTEAPEQFEYYTQPSRYPSQLRSIYKQAEASYQVEDPGPEEASYPTSAPIKSKSSRTVRPTRRPKYQTTTEETNEEFQPIVKYQPVDIKEQDEEYDEPAVSRYQEEPVSYRRPVARLTKVKYSPIEESGEVGKQNEGFLKYQQPEPRRTGQYEAQEQEASPKQYLRQYQEQDESQQVHRYHPDLAYQSSSGVANYRHKGAFAVSYRQDLPNSSVRYHRNLEAPTSYIE